MKLFSLKLLFKLAIFTIFFIPFLSTWDGQVIIKIHNADEFPTVSNQYNWKNLIFQKGKWLNLWMVVPEEWKNWKDYFLIISERALSPDTCWNTYFLTKWYNLKQIWDAWSFDWRFIVNSSLNSNKIFVSSIKFDDNDIWKDFRFTLIATNSWVIPRINEESVAQLTWSALNLLEHSQFIVSAIDESVESTDG